MNWGALLGCSSLPDVHLCLGTSVLHFVRMFVVCFCTAQLQQTWLPQRLQFNSVATTFSRLQSMISSPVSLSYMSVSRGDGTIEQCRTPGHNFSARCCYTPSNLTWKEVGKIGTKHMMKHKCYTKEVQQLSCAGFSKLNLLPAFCNLVFSFHGFMLGWRPNI